MRTINQIIDPLVGKNIAVLVKNQSHDFKITEIKAKRFGLYNTFTFEISGQLDRDTPISDLSITAVVIRDMISDEDAAEIVDDIIGDITLTVKDKLN